MNSWLKTLKTLRPCRSDMLCERALGELGRREEEAMEGLTAFLGKGGVGGARGKVHVENSPRRRESTRVEDLFLLRLGIRRREQARRERCGERGGEGAAYERAGANGGYLLGGREASRTTGTNTTKTPWDALEG